MIVIMNPDATWQEVERVVKAIEGVGLKAKVMEGTEQKIVGLIGDKRNIVHPH